MNTFLPCADFNRCARVLDPERLSRQVAEVVTLARSLLAYQALLAANGGALPWGFQLAPVFTLWTTRSGEVLLPELHSYELAMHDEWLRHHDHPHGSFRGFNWGRLLDGQPALRKVAWPEHVHESHRGKLYRKDASYYGRSLERCGLSVPKGVTKYEWDHPMILGNAARPCEDCGQDWRPCACL